MILTLGALFVPQGDFSPRENASLVPQELFSVEALV